jgi:hypothetical protein
MKTANKQLGIFIVKIPQFRITKALAPELRYVKHWLARLRGFIAIVHRLFFQAATPVRIYAPGQRAQEEHNWRINRGPRLNE